MADPISRHDQAMRLGELACLRLRAEVLLERIYDKADPIAVTGEDRDRLDRIASAPKLDDRGFLGRFDHIYEADETKE